VVGKHAANVEQTERDSRARVGFSDLCQPTPHTPTTLKPDSRLRRIRIFCESRAHDVDSRREATLKKQPRAHNIMCTQTITIVIVIIIIIIKRKYI